MLAPIECTYSAARQLAWLFELSSLRKWDCQSQKKSALSIRSEKVNFFFSFQLDALYPAGSTLTAELASGVDPVEAMRKAVEVCDFSVCRKRRRALRDMFNLVGIRRCSWLEVGSQSGVWSRFGHIFYILSIWPNFWGWNRKRKEKSNVCDLSFYIGYFGDSFERKKNC